MPRHEGTVTGVKDDGTALVLIRPEDSEIPGAPSVNVCHCTSESSAITFEAVNRAGASCGDRVSVHQKASALLKNAAALVAAPLAGGLLGALTGMMLYEGFAIRITATVLGLALGVLAGAVSYRRISASNPAEITHILQKRTAEMPPDEAWGCVPSGGKPAGAGCEGCGLFTPSSRE